MTFLSRSEVKGLKLLVAPTHIDFSSPYRNPGKYFRDRGITSGNSRVCELAYCGLQPESVLSLDMANLSKKDDYRFDKPIDWIDRTVYHGTNIAMQTHVAIHVNGDSC